MLKAVQLKLWEAAELGDATEVRRCLDAGAETHVANRLGWNALHRACMSGSTECVELLLPTDDSALVALLAKPDGAGNLPLHIAAGRGHAGVVRLLLRSGAPSGSPTLEPKEGGRNDLDTPMHTACKALAASRTREAVEPLLDVVVELIAGGGLLEATDARGRMAAAYLPPPLRMVLLARIKPAAPVADDSAL